jgi:AmmeMemoRadiSam system protein B
VRRFEAPFDGEHCLEVQLPFLQVVLEEFRVVPFLVGDAGTEDVAQVIERLWGGDETLIVISSDLSHYLDYDSAKAIDAETSRAIEALRPEAIAHHQACGRNPLGGLLQEAKRRGLQARTLDLRNSGDTAGPRSQVVGYGAYEFC